MKPARKSLKLIALSALLALTDSSCRPAAYEILMPKKGRSAAPTGSPVSPPEAKTESPTSTGTPSPTGESAAPTARVEVIWNGESVVKVRVNEPTTIRPTADTLDPDDIGKSSCVNPGIVKAAYDVGHEATPSVVRPGCEPLSVPHTFTKTGDYEITLVVTSNENETATAKMTLTVVDASTPLTDGDGGFTITADPMIGGKDTIFTFNGYCALTKAHTITWDFGDGKAATGVTVTHVFAALGAHEVAAKCTDTDGKTIDAQVTVVTMANPAIPPKNPTPPVIPTVPVAPPTTPTTPPTQKPTQGTAQQPTQGGTVPCPCTTPDTGTWYYPSETYYVPY